MVSADPKAISAVLTAPSTATAEDLPGLAAAADRPADWTAGVFYVLVPDISDETAAEITKAKAWPAWMAFCRSLRRRSRKGPTDDAKAAARSGVLDDEGIRGLARSIGMTPKAMSRQIAALQAIGVLAAFRPPASMTRDPDTGRIVRRPAKAGRVEACRIVLTVGREHLRPAGRQGSDRPLDPSGPRDAKGRLRVGRTPSQADPKGRSDTTSKPPVSIPPSAPPADGEAGRPAEDARQRPDGRTDGRRQAGHERGRVAGPDVSGPPNATTEATPTPPAEAEAGTQVPVREDTGSAGHLDRPDHRDRTEAGPSGPDRSGLGRVAEDPWSLTRRKVLAEASTGPADGTGMDASQGSWAAEYRRLIGRPDSKATTADEAADRLRRSLDELPDESRQRAADLGHDMADIEDEARRLAEIVDRRRQEDAANAKAEAAVRAEDHRQAWHRKRAEAAA